MQDSHRKSVIRLVSFIASASNGLFGALFIAASFGVARYPISGWNIMVAVFAITGTFFLALSIAMLVLLKPWRSVFLFYSKEDEIKELLFGLVESNKQIISRLEKLENRVSNIEIRQKRATKHQSG